MSNYIYLLREREFIKTGEHVYKIGKTTQNGLGRFKNYPKGSELILHIKCADCHTSEKHLIEVFKEKYIRRSDIGLEYFEGNYLLMIDDITKYLANISNLPNKKHEEDEKCRKCGDNSVCFDGMCADCAQIEENNTICIDCGFKCERIGSTCFYNWYCSSD